MKRYVAGTIVFICLIALVSLIPSDFSVAKIDKKSVTTADSNLIRKELRYEPVDYITSLDGATYLDTGLYASSNTKAEIKYKVVSYGTYSTGVFGAFSANSSNTENGRFQIYARTSGLGHSVADTIYKSEDINPKLFNKKIHSSFKLQNFKKLFQIYPLKMILCQLKI